jgi:hypothetical protein
LCTKHDYITLRSELGQLYTRIEYDDELTSECARHFSGMPVRRLVGFRSIPWKPNKNFSYLQQHHKTTSATNGI